MPDVAESSFEPSTENNAISRCFDAYEQAYDGAHAKKESDWACRERASAAYRAALPPLDSPANICDFIACVAYAMAIEVITGSAGTRLLYAAQVAGSTQKRAGRPKAE